MIGKDLGNYKVLAKIGSGGMGEVYLARDTRLNREVALKFLPERSIGNPEQLARLLREAQAAAALKHPNILTVHEITKTPAGQSFIVMDYYPGKTLMEQLADGPLAEEKALEITWAIAEGLASAHAAGIVHRDIKPTNVMISDDMDVKILDFGLAKVSDQTTLTRENKTFGTAAYMSPEQASGGAVDHRTDIWSLGVVLYQMLSGNLPFPGEFSDAVIYGILHNPPAALPGECCQRQTRAILEKMLAKDPDQRYPDLEDFLRDLGEQMGKARRAPAPLRSARRPARWKILAPALVIFLAAAHFLVSPLVMDGRRSVRRSVAALPFTNLTGDEQSAIWSKGIPQMITAELSRSPELYVLNPLATSTVYAAMGSPSTAGLTLSQSKDFAQRTEVETLILGSIMKAGERWRIQVHLQDALSGNLLTSATATADSEDRFFAAADSLASAVKDFLEIREISKNLSYGVRKYAAGTESAAAYREFLEAYEAYRRREWGQAKMGFEKALALDADYTSAQYMLVWTLRQLGEKEMCRDLFEVVNAKRNSLPVTDQYSLDAMGAILDKDHWQAIQSLKKVVDRDPQLRAKWGQLGALYLSVEETELARSALEEAMSLTVRWGDRYPWVHLYRNLAQVYVDMGLFDQAIAIARLGLETGEQNRRSMLFWLSVANIAKGDHEEARKQLASFTEELHSKGIDDIIVCMNVGFIHLKAGKTAQAIPQMREAVAGDPAFFPAVSWLATMFVDAGQALDAEATLVDYLERFPDHLEAQVSLARIRIENDLDLDGGLADLEALRDADPQLVDAEFLETLGMGYVKQERWELAVHTLEKAWASLGQYDHQTHAWLQKARLGLASR